MFIRRAQAVCALMGFSYAVAGQTSPEDQGKQQVSVQAIRVKGSRLPESSIVHLTGLKAGQTLDEAKLRAALQHATDSGLFKNINYAYESAPGGTNVILELSVEDQLPLVPATVKIAKVNPEDVWHYLAGVDPLFTRELPTSVNAIGLYSRYMTKYLQSLGIQDFGVVGNVVGRPTPAGVEFVAVSFAPRGADLPRAI